MNVLPGVVLTKLLNIPVILIIWTRDQRNYQTIFQLLHHLAPGEHNLMIQMASLNRQANVLRLFIDCKYIGEEKTEMPIRDAFLGRIVVVGYLSNTILSVLTK